MILMKSFRLMMLCIPFLTFGILSACATKSLSTSLNASNFRSRLEIIRPDVTFYSAQYIGPSTNKCFPPITNKICRNIPDVKVIYGNVKKLGMEEFEIRFSANNMPYNDELTDDLKYLVAADLALQRGYPLLVPKSNAKFIACTKSYSTTTYGTVNNFSGSFEGSTYLNEDLHCSQSRSGRFIFLRDPKKLKAGVFYDYGSETPTNIKPVKELYYGTTPNIYIEDVYSVSASETEGHTSGNTTPDLWKKVYSAAGLSRDLRDKYSISNGQSYTFIDRRDEKTNREINTIDKNLIPVE
jgi:hypothetical protein